ncbi:MAG: hypothetical protein EBS29_12255 [Chloroflexia bacterium]|nr:hypothetical protein [Chloroflexia bacterium]
MVLPSYAATVYVHALTCHVACEAVTRRLAVQTRSCWCACWCAIKAMLLPQLCSQLIVHGIAISCLNFDDVAVNPML